MARGTTKGKPGPVPGQKALQKTIVGELSAKIDALAIDLGARLVDLRKEIASISDDVAEIKRVVTGVAPIAETEPDAVTTQNSQD